MTLYNFLRTSRSRKLVLTVDLLCVFVFLACQLPSTEQLMATSVSIPRCKNLVLDSGPLLSLSPLRGLAATYLTVPQVLNELKDKRAREHFEQLGLSAGVKIEVRSPDAASLSYGTLCYLTASNGWNFILSGSHTICKEDGGLLCIVPC
jgi:hypothetical protein